MLSSVLDLQIQGDDDIENVSMRMLILERVNITGINIECYLIETAWLITT